jgi:hypothetical protein
MAPVAWFKFTPRGELPADVKCDPYADVLGVELARLRWGRLACVKLIACENRMDEWEDHHGGGLYKPNPVDPQLESAWFQPLNLSK